MKKGLIIISVLVSLIIIAPQASASILDWKVSATEHFTIFYPKGYQYQAQKTAYYLEKHRQQILDLTGNNRDFKAHVVIQDTGVVTNGMADPVATKISIFTPNPPSTSTLSTAQDWLRMVSVHEFTHLAQLNNYSGSAALPADLFGNLFSPNVYSPLWVIEGITVYSESQLSDYGGRLKGGYYDALVANKAQAGELPSILEANYPHDYYPQGQHYLYGGVFFRYLAQEYGEDKLADYFQLYGSYHWAPFWGSVFPGLGVDLAAKEVFGKSFPELFADWKAAEQKEHQSWSPGGELIAKTKRGTISHLTAGEGKLYYIKQDRWTPYPFIYRSLPQLMEFNPQTGEEKRLAILNGQPYSSLQIRDSKLYYALYAEKGGYPNVYQSGRGIVGRLCSYNLQSGRQTEILTAELNAFTVTKEGVIYTTDLKGKFGSQIWRYQAGRKEKIAVTEQLIGELARYQDQFVTVSKPEVGSWNINFLQLPEAEVKSVIKTPWTENQIKVVDNQLYFTANYDQQLGVYQYNPAAEQVAKVSLGDYAVGGIAYQNQLYFISLTSSGEALYRNKLLTKSYSLPSAEKATPELPDFSAQKLKSEPALGKNLSYLLRPNIRLVPYLASGADALGLNHYTLTLASDYQGVNAHFSSQLLSPLTITAVSRAGDGERSNSLSLAYPVYQSQTAGLTKVKVNYETDFKASIPGLELSAALAQQSSSVEIKNNLATGGINTYLTYRYLLPNGRIKLTGNLVDNFDIYREIRGFTDEIESASGYQASFDFTHQLAALRTGLWNPNLYFGDLYGTVFVEQADLDSEMTAYGTELSLETGAGFRLNFTPRLGVSTSTEKTRVYFRIEGNF